MEKQQRDTDQLAKLIALIKKLRSPDGCPWDREQQKEDIGKYLLEESYEVVDALETKNPQALKEELGDLLFQILFIGEICTESGLFSLEDVMDGIHEKMIRRHPHVFGDTNVNSVQEVKYNWQQIKQEERKNTVDGDNPFSGIPRSLPALRKAQKISSLASGYGFDWEEADGVWQKIKEELREFEAAAQSKNPLKTQDEFGDILFTMVNLSRFLGIDAETALNGATAKFVQRFSRVTQKLALMGITWEKATPEQTDALWNDVKKEDSL